MKTIIYEAKPVNGIPNLTEYQIDIIINQNNIRKREGRLLITKESLLRSLETLKEIYSENLKPAPVKSTDHSPCIKCGSISFIRTGSCFCCEICGSSQGCS